MQNLSFFARKVSAHSGLNERENFKSYLKEMVDCENTVAMNSLNPSVQCPSSSSSPTGPYFRLARKASSPSFLGGDLIKGGLGSGSFPLGDYHVRASCSEAEDAFIVQAVKIKGNRFVEQNYRGQVISWDEGLLIAGSEQFCPLSAVSTKSFGAEIATAEIWAITATSNFGWWTNPSASKPSGGVHFNVIEGPRNAFIATKGFGTPPEVKNNPQFNRSSGGALWQSQLAQTSYMKSKLASDRVRGAYCNSDEGWQLANCYLGVLWASNGIVPAPNGCIFVNYNDTIYAEWGNHIAFSMTITCVK